MIGLSGFAASVLMNALKFLMKEVNLCEPHVMPPLQSLPAEEEHKLRKEFEEIINKYDLKF